MNKHPVPTPSHRFLLSGLTVLLSLVLNGCFLIRVPDYHEPAVAVPEVFSEANGLTGERGPLLDRWWEAFGDPELNAYVENALQNNHNLRQAWRRLQQLQAVQRISRSEGFPQVDTRGSASKTETTERNAIDPASTMPGPMGQPPQPRTTKIETEVDRFVYAAGLGWEIDIWGRILAANRSDRLDAEATRQDAEETALILTGQVVENWFRLIEQRLLIDLLEEQVEVGETLEELTGLRFGVGTGSALDVLQQRQQVAATRAELPPVKSQLSTLRHALALLMGRPSRADDFTSGDFAFPDLPPLPDVGNPALLLARRPDLRAARMRVQAADYDVASAIADRLPRLSFSIDYDLSAEKIGDIYDREVLSAAGNVLLPLIDGGRRRAEVTRRKAVAQERLDRFSQLFLEALVEVEDALAQERYQLELLEQINEQVELAETSLGEARSRYTNGLNDYLTVINAINALQRLQRQQISQWRQLLVIRANLYRALGGSWMSALEPPEPTVADATNENGGEVAR